MDFTNYISPFSWRYGSQDMRQIWSEANKRILWRKIWAALAKAENAYNLVTQEQLDDINNHLIDLNIDRALQIESEIHHDLMAELKTFAEQCPLGGGVLHLGATSMDIEDNADAIRLRLGLDLVIRRLNTLLLSFADQIDQWAQLPVMAYTHIQPAEPTTLGYRLSMYAQDLMGARCHLMRCREQVKGKGFKGAVGSGASYGELIGLENLEQFEDILSQSLNLPFYKITTQTYPRIQDYEVISALSLLAIPLYKFAFDFRMMQSPPIGEWNEPFGKHQVGSSAMPFKRNPINSEKIDSLARMLAQMPLIAWNNAAHSLLERTLDDSANRRSLLPESFLICDEILIAATRLIDGLKVNIKAIERNFKTYGPFASTERLLMALGKAGADRQYFHEKLREHAMQAWEKVQNGEQNLIIHQIKNDPEFSPYVTPDEIEQLLHAEDYTGIASIRSRQLAADIRKQIGEASIE